MLIQYTTSNDLSPNIPSRHLSLFCIPDGPWSEQTPPNRWSLVTGETQDSFNRLSRVFGFPALSGKASMPQIEAGEGEGFVVLFR